MDDTTRDMVRSDAELITRLISALAWYADIGNYDGMCTPGTLDPQAGTWHVDCGDRARAALSDHGGD